MKRQQEEEAWYRQQQLLIDTEEMCRRMIQDINSSIEYFRQVSLEMQKETMKRQQEEEAWYRQQQLLIDAEEKRRRMIQHEEQKLVDQRKRWVVSGINYMLNFFLLGCTVKHLFFA